jgi:hypothetical protein
MVDIGFALSAVNLAKVLAIIATELGCWFRDTLMKPAWINSQLTLLNCII